MIRDKSNNRPVYGWLTVLVIFMLFPAFFPLELEAVPSRQSAPVSDEPFRLLATYQEKKGDMILAAGQVELHFEDLTLLCDRLQLNTATYDLQAEGQVCLQLPSEVVNCQRLTYNLKTRESKLEDVQAISRPSLLFGAKEISQNSTEVMKVKEAWLTSCTQPVPRWSFSFKQAELKTDDYVSMSRAVFSIKKVPVFYLPYLKYPLKERATGFLFPEIGYNQVKGLAISQSFYWAIARNREATLTADYYSSQGAGTGIDYRYLLRGKTKGEASAYVFFFKRQPDSVQPDPGYLLRWSHQQLLPGSFQFNGQVDYSSSFDFLREYENNFSLSTSNNRSYQFNLTRNWSYFSLNLRASRFETYFPATGQKVISNYFPQLNFNLLKYRLSSSLYLSWESGLTNWHYSYQNENQPATSLALGQAFFRPLLSLPFSPAPFLNLSFFTTGLFSYYFQSYAPGTATRENKPLLTAQARLGFNLEGPIFYRIFFRGGEPYLKHLIVPFCSYTFESLLSQSISSRIISPLGFYRDDDLKYGFTQHLLIKNGETSREIVTFGLSQVYYFDPATSRIRFYYPQNPDRHLAPLNGLLRFYLQTRFSLDLSADYNTYENNFLSFRLSANYGAPSDNFFLGLNWSKSYQILAADSFFRSNQLGLQASFRLPARLDFKGQIEYDLQLKKVIYTGLSCTYHYQCLDFSLDLRIFNYRLRPETQFRFSVGLGNISRSSDFLGGFAF
ncbi:MAG: LPS-assembly protein LptD [Candidatus Saccharicenans sp.]|nr:LPS-assembly protein LptD [Candidatus Saccharicenans sp.]